MPHLDAATLAARLSALAAAPRDRGVVRLLVQRLPGEGRVRPARVELDRERGVVGDRWALADRPDPEDQVTLMRHDVARLLRDGDDPAILGDNLFADLDTSAANLPAGTVLRVGGAVLEVTPAPHAGCRKFAARVGADALALTLDPAWRAQNLRGVHLRVRQGGSVAVGDEVVVVERPGRE